MADRTGAHPVLFVALPVAPSTPWVEGHAHHGAVVVCSTDLTTQLACRFAMAWVDAAVLAAPPEVRRAGLHQAVQHLLPGGIVAADATVRAQLFTLGAEFDLTVDDTCGDGQVVVLRRPSRTTVHDILFEARAMIGRVDPPRLSVLLASSEPPLVVDTRTHVDRDRTGVIAGAIHVPRTVLEWHLDPANGYRHPAVESMDRAMVLVCNGGYSSSLAAANLTRIGFGNVADLVGGMHAWCASGLPTVRPDHSYVDL